MHKTTYGLDLQDIVQSAQNNPQVLPFILRQAIGILSHLGVDSLTAEAWLRENISFKNIDILSVYEKTLHDSLMKLGAYESLSERMKDRASAWFGVIKPFLKKDSVLDLGGGSGEVANLMLSFGAQVSVADSINWLKYEIPFISVTDNHISVHDNSFNQVVLLTVFHHTDNPQDLIREAFRVAKNRVIFIESVTNDLTQYMYGAWVDWFYNRVLHYSDDITKKINVPCNFLPVIGWEQLVWKCTGLQPTHSASLGIFQHLNPEDHHLFVYDK